VIAGLIKAENEITKQSPPWLGKVPILGALFRSTQFQREETDLVIIITPRLVKPISPNQQVATPFDGSSLPNDPEIFLVGMEEKKHKTIASIVGPNGQRFPIGHILDF
jgi:pilus assembly protein CpaC